MIRNGKAIDHSNTGGFWGSLIAWIVAFGALLGAVYAMGFWDFTNVWVPGLIALALSFLAMFIPKGILGRGDTLDTVAIHALHPAEVGHVGSAPVAHAPSAAVAASGSHAPGHTRP